MALRFYEEKPQPARSLGAAGDDTKIVTTVKNWQREAWSFVTTWASNQVKWHKLRMRIKKKKTFPFPGCSNIRLPTLDTKIKKLKAALVNVIFGVRPVVQVIPTPSGNWGTALKIEKFLDHLIMDVIRLKPKAVIAIDQELEKGFYLLKPYWRLEVTTRVEELNLDDLTVDEAIWLFDVDRTVEEVAAALGARLQVDTHPMVAAENQQALMEAAEKILDGADRVTVALQDILYNFPDVDLCPPERVYVPTTTGYDPQSAQYIIHEFFLPLSILKQYARHKGWNEQAIEEIDSKRSVDWKQIDITKDEREGIERLQSTTELVKIWECYGWYDINDDGVPEKCVITIAPDFNKLLRKITLPFYSGKWPFVKLFYELTDDRWFSHRGIPELIEDIVKEIDIQHMQRIDYGTITNAPIFLFRAGQVNKNVMQFIFGQGIPVQGMQPLDDIIKPLHSHNPNIDFSYEREQLMLETKIEELIGQIDFTLHSLINKRQPRTLGEVQLQWQNQQLTFSLDADLHRHQFEELFNWIWDLWCQYGDDEYEFAYFGKDGWERIKLTKEEIQGKYKITVRGNDQNTNPQIRLQKAQMVMMAIQNPAAIQAGVITPQNIANAYKLFFQELDIPNWEGLVTMPAPQPPQTAPIFRPRFRDLTDAEKAQILAQLGIQPDIAGRMLEKQRELKAEDDALEKEATEMALKVLNTLKQQEGGNGRKSGVQR